MKSDHWATWPFICNPRMLLLNTNTRILSYQLCAIFRMVRLPHSLVPITSAHIICLCQPEQPLACLSKGLLTTCFLDSGKPSSDFPIAHAPELYASDLLGAAIVGQVLRLHLRSASSHLYIAQIVLERCRQSSEKPA